MDATPFCQDHAVLEEEAAPLLPKWDTPYNIYDYNPKGDIETPWTINLFKGYVVLKKAT